MHADKIDSLGETALVVINTDDGLQGFGEANVSPLAVSAFISQPDYWLWNRGVAAVLTGRDFSDPETLWDELYASNLWSARSGIGHIALGALDMALWDLAGKASNKPVWQLIGGGRSTRITPYITMYRHVDDSADTIPTARAFIDEIKDRGFRAAKVEVSHDQVTDATDIASLVEAVRDQAGPDFVLLCDACYRFRSAGEAARVITQLEDYDLMLFEAPLLPDDLDGYRRISEATTIPIAGCEICTSYAEFEHLLDFGNVQYVQPSVARLGVTAMNRVAQAAAARKRGLIPYGWVPTTLGTVASLHIAAANNNVPIVEYVPPIFYPYASLRKDICGPEPELQNGSFDLPQGPGFGVEINWDAADRLRHPS